MKRLVLIAPVLERVWPTCRDCEYGPNEGGHALTLEQCVAERDGRECPAPAEHHPFRAMPRWRQLVRRAKPWEVML